MALDARLARAQRLSPECGNELRVARDRSPVRYRWFRGARMSDSETTPLRARYSRPSLKSSYTLPELPLPECEDLIRLISSSRSLIRFSTPSVVGW